MPKRIKDYASAATTIASDDYFAIDGATNGTRKALLSSLGTTGILFGAGTAAAPKLAVGTSSNGIYAPSGNTLGFSTNGAQQWRIDSFGTLVSDVQSTPVLRFQPALPGTTCGVEWFDTGAVLAAYAKYNVTSPQLEINAGKSGSTGRIVFYTNTTDVGRFTSSQCFLVGTTSETGLTGAAGMKVASSTLATSGSTGALVVAGSAGFGKKCFITDGSTGAQLRLEYTAASVYTDLATLSTGHFLMTTTGGNRITSTTTNDTSVLARQVQGGLAFDGVTAGAKEQHTIGSNIGTGDATFYARLLVPSANPSANNWIFTTTTNPTTDTSNGDLFCNVGTTGKLAIGVYAAGGYAEADFPSFVATYGGKIVDLMFTRSGTTIALYINGVAQTTTDASSGGILWSTSINTTYASLVSANSAARSPINGSVFAFSIFNRALSASEVITLANQGVQETDKWGSLTAKYTSAFAAGVTSGFSGAAGTTVTGILGPIVGDGTARTDILKVDSGAGTACASDNSTTLIYGKPYVITYKVYVPSSNVTGYTVYLESTSGNITGTPNDLITANTWTTITKTITAWSASTGSGIRLRLRAGASATVTAGDVFYVDDVVITQTGSILDADLSAGVGYQVPDRSSNKYHGVVSATGTSWTLAQRRGQVRATTNTSGNQQIFSQVSLPTNAIITSIVGYTTGTPTVYVGNVSGGSQLVASVAMSASTYTSFTLAAITSTTGNVWVNSSTSDTINWTITYMIADP